jgi:hypothetical protein
MPRSGPSAREVWTREKLLRELAIFTGAALEPASALAYESATQSYITFCERHNLPIDPTPLTLAFYVTYMCHHINPRSVESYLSGICNNLKPHYPHIRDSRRHPLVTKTLKGAKKMRALPITRKSPLTRQRLGEIVTSLTPSSCHDTKLFMAILTTGFHALLRLGELVWPDRSDLQDYRKVTLRSTVKLLPAAFLFFLPGHKADRFFEGNRVLVLKTHSPDDPFLPFTSYLKSRDHLWPYNPELWLRANGSVPTHGWFLQLLCHFVPPDISGHSLRAGGATALAEAGVPLHIIQASGRWASDTFQSYIRQHPAILARSLLTLHH